MINSTFGENLDDLISDKKISYQKLADDLNIALGTIYRWKTNKADIALSYLLAIAKYFNCSLEFLSGRTDDEHRVNHKKELPVFSANVRKVMAERKISTYTLRKQTHFDGAYFYKWDNGADPKLSTLVELSELFNCTLDYLVGLE